VQKVIIDILTLVLNNIVRLVIIYCKKGVLERRDIEKLLDHRIHVTNAAKVFETAISCNRSTFKGRVETAFLRLLYSHYYW
jgi:hypothetical protein